MIKLKKLLIFAFDEDKCMIFAFYELTAFERTVGIVIIITFLVVILAYHVRLIRKILESEKAGKGKRIVGMVAIASIFWAIGIYLFYPIFSSDFFIFGFSFLGFVTSMVFSLIGGGLLSFGSTLGFDIVF